MLLRRLIPCLDIRDGRVVKGIQFADLRDVGDPVALARHYADTGADELCFLDVTASLEDRPLLFDLVERLSRVLFIPFTVGGGVRTIEDARALLRCGADKIAISSAAVGHPAMLTRLANEFGSQCIVLSIDAIRADRGWRVTTHGGRRVTSLACIEWARIGVSLGVGEILLNVIDADGKCAGFHLEITADVTKAVTVPVIASGGAGSAKHFRDVFRKTDATGALAATIFHDGMYTPNELKNTLKKDGIEVRL